MKNVRKILALVLVSMLMICTFAACTASPQKAILGTWRDSVNTKGYEFKDDNTCIINVGGDLVSSLFGFEGDINGVYTVEEAEDGTAYVTITYTVFSKSMTEKYMFKVEGASLTMTNMEDQTSTVYIAYEKQETTVAAGETTVAA